MTALDILPTTVSSTHLEVPGHGGILLDAGEGTLGQLARLCGPENVINVLSNLKCIFISHLHADHHSGLTSLLKFRTKVRPKRSLSSFASR